VSEIMRKSAGESSMTLDQRKRRFALRIWCAAEVWCIWPFQKQRESAGQSMLL